MQELKKFKHFVYILIIIVPILALAWPHIPYLFICVYALFISSLYLILDFIIDKQEDEQFIELKRKVDNIANGEIEPEDNSAISIDDANEKELLQNKVKRINIIIGFLDCILLCLLLFSFWEVIACDVNPNLSIFVVGSGWEKFFETISYALICSCIFYFLTVKLPHIMLKKHLREAIHKRLEKLKKEFITNINYFLEKQLPFDDVNDNEYCSGILKIADVCWGTEVGYPISSSEYRLSRYVIIRNFCFKIRIIVSETLANYHKYLSSDELAIMQEAIDSNIYILLANFDKTINKDKRMLICNDLSDVFHKISYLIKKIQ